ncbi:MAG TPA: hypothetical protein VM123_07660 [archaeon]|nr:hypothetical protein [archaeon]
MKRPVASRSFIFVLLLVLACSPPKTGEKKPLSAAELAAAFEKSRKEEEGKKNKEFNLMDHSVLDTCRGVFEGDWDEKVSEDITCRAAVRVNLEDCRITWITITDSSYLNPDAARLIPQRIIESQRLPVDAVSGASVSSWTLMTAVAVALGIDLMELEE